MATHNRAYATLDVAPVPDLYLTQFPIANAMTVGVGQADVVVQSELRGCWTTSSCVPFSPTRPATSCLTMATQTALSILLLLGRVSPLPLPLAPVRATLMEWYAPPN